MSTLAWILLLAISIAGVLIVKHNRDRSLHGSRGDGGGLLDGGSSHSDGDHDGGDGGDGGDGRGGGDGGGGE